MFSYTRKTKNPYIAIGMLCSGFLVCGAAYIYGVNASAVHTLAMEKGRHHIRETEEEVRMLEVERSRIAVGSFLEERAFQQHLSATGPVFFISRDAAVAQLD